MEKTKEESTPKIKKEASVKKLTAKLYMVSGDEAGSVELPEGIFNVNASEKLLAQYVRVYLANQRQGTHKTKKRGEINASTRKIYKQKGTGRARHGAKSAPIFVGGGVAHGLEPRDYTLKMNKKQRQKALYTSLTLKRKDEALMILKDASTASGKTKEMNLTLKKWGVDMKSKALFIYAHEEKDSGFGLSLRNIEYVHSTDCHLLNAYEVLNAKKILFTQEGLNEFIKFRGFAK
ncbi:50S ribosomal protein L4 [Candidatus Woesebacteria bacterium]|nr:50S ribosomal protein L4 [Candidatus Woesebacteria bacterium]